MSIQNNQNPVIPQGSRFQQQAGRKSKWPVAVFVILALHAVIVGGLLIQGCKKEEPKTDFPESASLPTETDDNMVPGSLAPFSEEPIVSTNLNITNALSIPSPSSEVTSAIPQMPVQGMSNPTISPTVPTAPVATSVSAQTISSAASSQQTTLHKVQPNESFYSISKKYNGVSAADIQAANPDVNPLRLKIGQELVIPAPSAHQTAVPSIATVNQSVNQSTYKVIPGDNLTRIARKFGVTIAALKSANNLSGDVIRVDQVLVIPIKSEKTGESNTQTSVAPAVKPQSPTVLPAEAPSDNGTGEVVNPNAFPSIDALTNTTTVNQL